MSERVVYAAFIARTVYLKIIKNFFIKVSTAQSSAFKNLKMTSA